MVQTYTPDCFSGSHVVQSDMAKVEENFAALLSAFSGTSQPSNTVEGMWWLDTSNHILKIRNEAGDAWLSIWDFVNNKPIVANLNEDITLAMLAAALKDPAASITGLRSLGTGSLQACAGNDARLEVVSDSAVSQAKLKTTTGSVSVTGEGPDPIYTAVMPGGQYGFLPQIRSSQGGTAKFNSFALEQDSLTSTYISVAASFTVVSSTRTCYAQQRYVQSSGEVHWIFSLRGRDTGIIIKEWQAPDHCCFGNGDDPELFQHPFGEYDQDKYELIVVNPPLDFVKELKAKALKTKCILEIIREEYEIDEQSSPSWPTKAVTVGLPQRWEEAWRTGESVKTIKSIIPRPEQAITRVLKKKI